MAGKDWYDEAWDCMDQEDYAQAKEYFEKAIEEGDDRAYCELGNFFFNGNGVEKDLKKAFELYLKGAKAGDSYCIGNLGQCYFWGHGTETDLQKAAYYNEKAASMGVVSAMFDTGLNYERGYGVPQNIDKALYWLERAAEEDYTPAYMELGGLYYTGEYVDKNLDKAFTYYQKGVELGDRRCKLRLSSFYENGIVVEKDIEKAKRLCQDAYDWYYEQAVTEDNNEAQYKLGSIFDSGLPLIGIDQDFSQAAVWYEKAALNGMDFAQNNLGIMYFHGVGVAQNYEKAFLWFSKAAEKMNREALSNLGICYYWGHGVKQDYSKAAEIHQKAANLGYGNSQEVMGELYYDGKGVEQNYTQAAYWFKIACDNGERSAFAPLGDCYRDGRGVEKNEKIAFELYQKGAQMNDLNSKVSMAECLIKGCGTVCNHYQAIELLETICNSEEEYRTNLITMTSSEDIYGRVFWMDPLDERNLSYYAKAYYLLGTLYYAKNKSGGSDVTKAIAMVRMADKLGYKNEDAPQETAQKLLNIIIGSTNNEQTCNARDCYVEVRERKKKGERYEVVLHHANATESVVNFKGRKKFIYILALLIAHKGNSVCGMTTTHFAFWRETLAMMAKTAYINVNSHIDWIDEFVYAETEESKDYDNEITICGFKGDRYSNALSGANKDIKASCTSDDEYEIFKLRSTGGRRAITTMALDNSQITLPDSLEEYLDILPTKKEIDNFIPKKCRQLPRRHKRDLNE